MSSSKLIGRIDFSFCNNRSSEIFLYSNVPALFQSDCVETVWLDCIFSVWVASIRYGCMSMMFLCLTCNLKVSFY